MTSQESAGVKDGSTPPGTRMVLIKAELRALRTITESGEVDFIWPIQERLVPSSRTFPYYLSWCLVSQLLVVPLFVVMRLNNEDPWLLGSFVLYAFAMAACASLPIWASKRLEGFLPSLCYMVLNDTKDVLTLYRDRLLRIFSTPGMVITGLVVASIAVAGEHAVGLPMKSFAMKLAFSIFDFIVMAFVGAGCYVLMMIGKFIDDLFREEESSGSREAEPARSGQDDRLQLDVSIYQHPEASLLSIGRLLLQLALAAVIPYLLAFAGRHVDPWEWNYLVWIWYGVFVIAVGSFFVLPQIGLHRIMVSRKRAEITKLADKIRAAAQAAVETPSEENISHLERLYTLEKHINAMKEWPFNIKAVLTVLTGLVLPLLLTLMEYVLGIMGLKT